MSQPNRRRSMIEPRVPVLFPCTETWGAATLIESDPVATRYRDLVYMPTDPSVFLDRFPRWGLFTRSGALVEEGAYYRLAEHVLIGQHAQLPDLPETVPAPDLSYVYGGPVIMHFGHFVTTALARLWPIVRAGLPGGARILVHSQQSPEQWFEHEYVRTLLGAIGLGPDDFARFDRPTALQSVLVPRAALEEQNFAHRVFGELCALVGRRLGIGDGPAGRGPPVYLSKSLHMGGTTRLVNEDALQEELAGRGVEVVHPETLPFADQVRVLHRASAVLCTLGSGLHSTLFCPEPTRILALTLSPRINSNYHLVDRLRGNDAVYVHSPTVRETQDARSTFAYVADDPVQLGAGLYARLKEPGP